MIKESSDYTKQVCWFTSLVSKKDNMKPLVKSLKDFKVADYRFIPMSQGQKQSRLIAWTYLSKDERADWAEKYWK